MAPAGPVRAEGHGLPEGYGETVADDRSVTDVSQARGQGRTDGVWILLAAAARYATTVAVKPRTDQPPADDVSKESPR
ncbi:hypothetical protein SAV31267_016700 [Streptomyces avermitilis]|nr:hypothetical protein SAV31267_016700 [Streptomyces avermitilis]